ncbi:hypothetical protein DFS34DRAFT_614384 [Phlyctochytrium arcticum]|nr:hypothetical protein DFS34DRAFT_614384 [Phlyctochytrium arcticum]
MPPFSRYSALLDASQGSGLVAWSAETGEPAARLDLEKTATVMLQRSTRRRANGRYQRKARKAQIFAIAMTSLVFLSLIGAGVSIFYPRNNGEDQVTVEQWSSIAVVIAFFIFLIFVIKMSLIVQWYFYVMAIAVVVLFIINKGKLVPEIKYDPSTSAIKRIFNQQTGPTIAVIASLIFLQMIILIATLFRRKLYPRMVATIKTATAVKWWRIRPVFVQPGTFKYTLYDPYSFSNENRTFSYTGSVNNEGRPHGYGMWCDDADTGEVTSGMWDDGRPVAPFKAREFGSGDSFTAIKVGFATCSHLDLGAYSILPKIDPNGLRYGVASIECSVSGNFFAELPQVEYPVPARYRTDMASDFRPGGGDGRPMDAILQVLTNLGAATCEHLLTRTLGRARPLPAPHMQAPTVQDAASAPMSMYEQMQPLRYRGPDLSHLSSIDRAQNRHPRTSMRLVVKVDPTSGALSVEGFQPTSSTSCSQNDSNQYNVTITSRRAENSEPPKVTVSGWEPDLPQSSVPIPAVCQLSKSRRDEALIFIHGYNSSVTDATKRFGQLLTLGDFPPWIKPFVFGWPSGSELTYFQALKAGLSPIVRDSFLQFLRDLINSGVRKFHILSHSAGCRLAVAFAQVFDQLFEPIIEDDAQCTIDTDDPVDTSTIKARLSTFTLLNADVPLAQFLDSDYMRIRRYCDIITSYVDENDGALFWGERFGGKKVLGRNPAFIYTVVPKKEEADSAERDEDAQEASLIDREQQFPNVSSEGLLQAGSSSDEPNRYARVNNINSHDSRTSDTLPTSRPNGFMRTKFPWNENRKARGAKVKFMLLSRFNSFWPATGATPEQDALRVSREDSWDRQQVKTQEQIHDEITRLQQLMEGRIKYAKELTDVSILSFFNRKKTKYLIYPDMDTIDTSLLDVNIHSIRHSYFNLNRMFVDDLLDIIILGKRASERTTRLAHTVQGGLVYQFLCAPSYVINP